MARRKKEALSDQFRQVFKKIGFIVITDNPVFDNNLAIYSDNPLRDLGRIATECSAISPAPSEEGVFYEALNLLHKACPMTDLEGKPILIFTDFEW